MAQVSDDQYRILLTFRCALRQFLHWSQQQAAAVGLTAQQHQLLLAVRAHPGGGAPSISDVAACLGIRHHSAVELVSRCETLGLVVRTGDAHDLRVVRLRLTGHGREVLDELTATHLAELERVAATLHISEQFLNQLSEDFIETVSSQPA